MIAQLVFATVLASSPAGVGTDPLEAALDYVEQMETTVEATEAAEEAAELARQQAIDRASRESDRQPTTIPSPGGSSDLPWLLQKIRSCESSPHRVSPEPTCGWDLSAYSYQAYNPGGCEGYGCGGAYQLHAQYASTWAARAGYPNMSSQAQNWPPEIQDAVALDMFYSTTPNGDSWCNWTDYC